MRKLALYALVCGWVFLNVNCGKDDDPNTTSDDVNPPVSEMFYNITQATINDDAYTAPGELSFLYSLNNGGSYTAEIPKDLSKGDELWVKINNGEVDIYEEDFYFDWSGSSLAPADAESDLAKFVVKEDDLTLMVTVVDKIELLVSNRDTGQFYVLDLTDGGLTPSFTLMENGEPVERIRGGVYNYNDGLLYLSTAQFGLIRSQFYSADLDTKLATLINDNNDDNDEEIWKGISDLVITPENLILATVGFGGGVSPSLMSFDTSGNSSQPMAFAGDDTPCCGLGLVYADNASEILVGSGQSSPVKIYKSNLASAILEVVELSLKGFPNTTSIDYSIRNLVKDSSGMVYALLFEDNDVYNTHIAKIDLENNKLIHVAKIGSGTEEVFYGMFYLPAYAF